YIRRPQSRPVLIITQNATRIRNRLLSVTTDAHLTTTSTRTTETAQKEECASANPVQREIEWRTESNRLGTRVETHPPIELIEVQLRFCQRDLHHGRQVSGLVSVQIDADDWI